MTCPFCSAETAPDALSCPQCHAFVTVQRTPIGVLTGWLGGISALLTSMVLIPVPFMLLAGTSLVGFPWILPGIGLALMTGFLLHSRSTRHLVWLAPTSTPKD